MHMLTLDSGRSTGIYNHQCWLNRIQHLNRAERVLTPLVTPVLHEWSKYLLEKRPIHAHVHTLNQLTKSACQKNTRRKPSRQTAHREFIKGESTVAESTAEHCDWQVNTGQWRGKTPHRGQCNTENSWMLQSLMVPEMPRRRML